MLVVLDTNVLVSGLRSVLGASNAVLRRLALGDFRVAVSTALCLENTFMALVTLAFPS